MKDIFFNFHVIKKLQCFHINMKREFIMNIYKFKYRLNLTFYL